MLAIHPEHASRIFRGTKRAELRRRTPSTTPKICFVYETAPVSKVTGWFVVGSQFRGTLTQIWRRFRAGLSLSRSQVRRYLSGVQSGTVFSIRAPRRLRRPLSLRAVTGQAIPPQSFVYLKAGVAEKFIRRSPSSKMHRAAA